VDGLLLGDIAKFGSVYQVNLKVIAAGNGKVLATHSERVGSEEALLDVFSRGAEHIALTVATALNRTTPVRVAAPPRVDLSSRPMTTERPLRKYSWIPAAAAVAGTVTGIVLWSSARSAAAQLTSPTTPLSTDRAAALRDSGTRSQTWALVSFGVSAAALATAATMFFWSREEGVAVTPVATLEGGSVMVSGRFP
jgi:hypothetical protein